MPNPSSLEALPSASLIVIDDPSAHAGALNMALDETLLSGLEDSALLRCYRWSGDAVSFGCFGRIAAVRASHPGVSLVRRWTGGGIVEHGGDFTYTLLVPRRLPLACLPAGESYRLIHGAVSTALSRAGILGVESAGMASDSGANDPGAAPFLQPCFTNPVAHDLLAHGRKVAGGAQRRTRHGLLHQGSIQGLPWANLREPSGRSAFCDHLASALAQTVAARPITAAEFAAAEELAASKYASRAWTEKY